VDSLTKTVQPSAVANVGGDDHDTRPGLVIVCNTITPYRVHLHRLIAAGVPELKLHTLITHGVADFDWQLRLPQEIHAANVSLAGEHPLDNPFRRPLVELRKGAKMARYLRDIDARAVIFYGYRYISWARLMDYCYRHGIPFFMHSDNNIRSERPVTRLKSLAKRRVYAWWLKRAAGVITLGRLGDEYFLKYGADPRRLYQVPCWPDYDAFSHANEVELERFRRKYGLDSNRRYLIFSGRLVRDKRVDLLLDAFAAIADLRPDWGLLIVGDGALADDLRRRVPEALRSRVVWTGFVDGADSALSYHAADVLVLPSEIEPWALVVQEAMAAGLTVVSSDVAGAAYELVTDKLSGRIFASGDCNALRLALEDVTHPDRIDGYKSEAMKALRRYREEVDPVAEIRRALSDVGVLKTRA
jgi:glycosyltransferase involved in cell wall biosynthesis